MKVNIIIETDENNKEYVLLPNGERESSPEDSITIEIKTKKEKENKK